MIPFNLFGTIENTSLYKLKKKGISYHIYKVNEFKCKTIFMVVLKLCVAYVHLISQHWKHKL